MAPPSNWKPELDEYFSDEKIQLALEVSKHPELLELCAKYPMDEFEMKLSEICHYVGIILDGDYLPSDITNICKLCTKRLITKRTGITFAREVTEKLNLKTIT